MNKSKAGAKKNRIIYVGFGIPEADCYSHIGANVSGNRMNLGVLEGLKQFYDNVESITIYPLATFPSEKKIFVRKEKIILFNDSTSLKVSFVNIFLLKQITQTISILINCIKLAKKNRKNIILAYNAYFITAIPTLIVSRIRKCKSVCLLADIPVSIPPNYNWLKKILRKIEIYLYYKTINKFDGLIVLNKHVVDVFAPGKKYLLMDGGVSQKEITDTLKDGILPHKKANVIFYAGALEKYNGINEMIEGFNLVKNKELELHICGDGLLKSFIENAVKINSNIKYFGIVPNAEVKKMQREAALLISTRPTDHFATTVTFPSKIIEYMLSGTPVLTTKLNGLTKDYEPYLYFTGQKSIEIAKSIDYVMNINTLEREEKAKSAQEFVISNKNYLVHGKRIKDFFENL
ncbi:MAG: glycosyltransferase [Clostridiaceae bacterium]